MLIACGVCKIEKFEGEYYTSNLTQCKGCVRAKARANYAANREYYQAYEAARNATPTRKAALAAGLKKHRARNPEKNRARARLNFATRTGKVVKLPCQHCGSTTRVQAHHHDYSKPLDVEWLCFACHREHAHGHVVNERMKSTGT